ncbi:hypothetical protein [Rhizobium lentis]|uniref:Uncharacterized protein n=1 Tax=Rhizobium lentis TaxID=1138194 RepID=A0A7W8UJX7_9HYPH|nr:hypothetical protein [Rhizobium lentis]MBB4572027.1 hypothetical protein [Rhizobium lentis]MBB5548781.1 hypothetical protein [Rhizobium lentis]MBB5559313.1 hypothetical protein [Rhizobium lentis]MBB5565164.1 hypothetical protein [Rhizobium lentis]
MKSLSIGEAGLLPTDPNDSTRMIRINWKSRGLSRANTHVWKQPCTGSPFPAFMELATMALITGLGGDDTFEWELSRNELGPGLELYSMNNCSYYKFPDDLFSR